MKTLWITLAPLLLGLLVVSGCHSGARIGDVTASAVDIRLVSATPQETQAELTLRYTNCNVFALGISRSTHKLYLNGDYAGEAMSHDPVGIPQVSSVTRKVRIQLENQVLLQKLRAAGANQTVSYRIESSFFIVASDQHIRINSSYSGQLDIGTPLGSGNP
jgi:LEA14-like dessication related protein